MSIQALVDSKSRLPFPSALQIPYSVTKIGSPAIIAEIFTPSILTFFLKQTLKSQKKTGKAGYSPNSQIEFYDDYFTETTSDGKTENKYSAVERISILDEYVYIHINSLMAYILPQSAFSSDEQYNDFLSFITSKCSVVDKY